MEEKIGRIAAMDFRKDMSVETMIKETHSIMLEYPNKWEEWNNCWLGKTMKEMRNSVKNKPITKNLLYVQLGDEDMITVFIVPKNNTITDLEENHKIHLMKIKNNC